VRGAARLDPGGGVRGRDRRLQPAAGASSTQLAIFCAGRVGGWQGALVGRWVVYALAGFAASAVAGPFVVLALVGCGGVEVLIRLGRSGPIGLAVTPHAAGLGSLAWTAFKVGALSFGGGFVIIPLMQSDAVSRYHWMTGPQFLDAVALGQVTPGPVVAVGYAAGGVGAALLAALVAFTPSFVFMLAGWSRFDRLRGNTTTRAFLEGAGPAAMGAIEGSSVLLAGELREDWQYVVLGAAAAALLLARRSIVAVLLAAAVAGEVALVAGAQIPGWVRYLAHRGPIFRSLDPAN